MPAYYFHCTDGYALVLDRRGHRVRSRREAERVAFAVAGGLMQASPGACDWSRWLVSVHDGRGGMVTVVPFPLGQA